MLGRSASNINKLSIVCAHVADFCLALLFSDSESSSSSDGEEFGRGKDLARDEDGFLAFEGKPGLFYKVEIQIVWWQSVMLCIVYKYYMYVQVHEFNPFAEQQCEVQTLLPHSSVLEENEVRNGWARKREMNKKLSYEKQLEQHTMSVQ